MQGRFRIGRKGNLIFVRSSDSPIPNIDDVAYYSLMNRLVLSEKLPGATNVVFLQLPNLNMDAHDWLAKTQALVAGLGPTFLVAKSKEQVLMSRKL